MLPQYSQLKTKEGACLPTPSPVQLLSTVQYSTRTPPHQGMTQVPLKQTRNHNRGTIECQPHLVRFTGQNTSHSRVRWTGTSYWANKYILSTKCHVHSPPNHTKIQAGRKKGGTFFKVWIQAVF